MDCMVYIEIDDGPHLKCVSSAELSLHEGDQCIVEADKLLEFGHVASVDEAGSVLPRDGNVPRVLRRATLQDQAKANENIRMNKMAMKTCIEKAGKANLAMRLVKVRYSFDRSVLMVLFTADERIDFREMINELAGELHVRVEMKQIGVRDEAGIVGGVGPCGRNLCCCSWLHHFESINVKMAKAQRLSLNPATMSGMCGRLKCCLRYEYDCYRELGKRLPRDGDIVRCPEGTGIVIDKNVLDQIVKVRLEDQRIVECSADNIQMTGGRRAESHISTEDEIPEEMKHLERGG
ncbi:MAG: regulatory iron-sulfur-containing complex subunit RicT [Kiritimatiellae bacterium]|nr:regulatory iron-sulfur-containing complex subunit RicT [Kiritimatiellia bacterium]MDD5520381.1 regulatory iron-sulfur-containing complex subunit RicT [Kiritimatiellia bacterium]